MMEERKIILTGLCPYCSAVLDYSEDARAVICHSCGNALPVSVLKLKNTMTDSAEDNDADRSIAEGVTSAAAGLIYMDNFCESFDWAEFATTLALSIPRLDTVAESCKVKFSSDPVTYVVDFRRHALPIMKKIEGLTVLEAEIINNYKNDDISDLFEYVDIYSAITKSIVEQRESVYKLLLSDIKMAKKFKAGERVIADLEASLDAFLAATAAVKPVEDITEITGYKLAEDIKNSSISAKYRKDGIDAEKTYQKATALLAEGNTDAAMRLFHAISAYKDSARIVSKHSSVFTFGDEFIELAGKRYYVKDAAPTYFNVSDPTETSHLNRSLYEIVDGVPSEAPALTHVSKLIGSFGTRIFFIRSSSSICCYDTESRELYANVRILDNAPVGDYVADDLHPILFSADRSKFFIRKKLRDEGKTGCFGKKKKTVNRQNNYSVVLVDMDKVTVSVALPAVVDIMDFYGDSIFYTTLSESGAASFRVCNVNDLSDSEILDAECVIHNVYDGKIIYSLWAPNKHNIDLYSIDISTKEVVLLDKNVSSYYATYSGKVFYVVGTVPNTRLYSVNLDGTESTEIMENAGRVCSIRSGWIYYVSGDGRNSCLMKVSTDGVKRIRVASRFERLIKMTNGYVYYVNTRDELRVVRCDGGEDRKIIDCVAKEQILIDEKKVFCLRYERIGTVGDNCYSLYSIDQDGKNLKKLVHGVYALKRYDENTIYLCSKTMTDFTVTVPEGKRHSEQIEITKEITKYSALNTKTGDITDVATIGIPTTPRALYKSGCLFRSVKERFGEVTEMPAKREAYERVGVTKAGAVLEEELAIQRAEEEKILKEKAERKLAKKRRKLEKRREKAERRQEAREIKEAKREEKRAKQQAREDKAAEKKARKAKK